MATRNLTLNVREEECREQMPVAVPVHFSPAQIKNHFVESMNGVKAQFTVADNLHINGNEAASRYGDRRSYWQRDYWIFIFMK